MVATGQGWFLDGVKEPTMPGIGRARVAGLVRVFGASPHSSPGVLPMGRKVVTVGRDTECEFALNDGATSRRHARIERRGEHHFIVDLESTNGTMVNGRRVRECVLVENDVVRIGDTVFRFTDRGCETHSRRTPEERVLTRVRAHGIVGGARMELLAHRVAKVAPTMLSVVIEGESGTGKELIARSIHDQSGRQGPFVAINCAALAATLIESELFGVRRGAFTGADRDREGLVKAANGGTLFLDEIGDMPKDAQAKLLRVLQEREVLPLGGTRTEQIDVRVVCATHRDLDALVKADTFRGDLLARLKEVSVRVPTLRERIEDVLPLLAHFLDAEGANAKPTFPFLLALAHYRWPYNVREFESAIKVALALAEGESLEPQHLPHQVQVVLDTHGSALDESSGTHLAVDQRIEKFPRFEIPDRHRLELLLREHSGNISAIARVFGKQRMQIHRWLKRYGLDPDAFRR
jgi:sigma-54 dependent transcriptional regulator, acetoin dehydrogenase operon transcriptional activator AcoR